ncbi:MAG: hypothetical protein AAF288_03315 [Planctomycetota bacterium]
MSAPESNPDHNHLPDPQSGRAEAEPEVSPEELLASIPADPWPCGGVSARGVRSSLWIDQAMFQAAGLAIVAGALGLVAAFPQSWLAVAAIPGLVIAAWFVVNTLSSRAARRVALSAGIEDHDLIAAERELAGVLATRPLVAWVRRRAFERLARLRLKRGQAEDASQIVWGLLQRQGPGPRRPTLLMLLAEARLRAGDVLGAYRALWAVEQEQASLSDRLRCLAVTVRYEAAIGRWDRVARDARARASMAELLSPDEAASVHALLAEGARRTGADDLARWLGARAELLGAGGRQAEPAS